jgi:hypothetical protein
MIAKAYGFWYSLFGCKKSTLTIIGDGIYILALHDQQYGCPKWVCCLYWEGNNLVSEFEGAQTIVTLESTRF